MIVSAICASIKFVSGIASIFFSGCALLISIISLFFSLRSGPVLAFIGIDKKRNYPSNASFKIPLIFYNGKTTAVVIHYSVILRSQAKDFYLPNLGRKVTLLVSPRNYEFVNLECTADSVNSPTKHILCIEWTFLKRGKVQGPYNVVHELKLLPPDMEVDKDENY